MKRVAIIMAGGSGERFWPLSRRERPKQLLNLTDPQRTMLHEAVDRLEELVKPEDIYVATGRHLVNAIRDAGIGIPDENILAEPCKRNTAGCLVYATANIISKYDVELSEISVSVTTADHIISETPDFRKTVEAILKAVETEDALGTIGIEPTRPETGYGYIEIPDALPENEMSDEICISPVSLFHEKPDVALAEKFAESGRHFWNSGMFFWRISTFLTELESARPDLAKATIELSKSIHCGDMSITEEIFEGLESISIDYALMEKARNVVVVRASFSWDDIGAWPALDRTYPHDDRGNVTSGNPVLHECTNCIVFSDADAEDMAVSVIGAENLVVVVLKDAVLVVPKDKAQDVKQAVSELKKRNAKQL